jgi:hypothetical protein
MSQVANVLPLSRWFVALPSLQYTVAVTNKEPLRPRPSPLYPQDAPMGDPAVAATNAVLLNVGPLRDEARREYANMTDDQIVTTLWNKGRHSLDVSPYFNNIFKPEIFRALSQVGRNIKTIVCFDFGTFEADNHSRLMFYPESVGCTAQHVFAFYVREHIQSTYGTSPELIFQHLEYTHATAKLLSHVGAAVFRDNASGFRCITSNTLVIWMCRDGHIALPVKQVIADFPYQNRPLQLPLAMIWPEEGDHPTTLEDILNSPQSKSRNWGVSLAYTYSVVS